MSLDDYHHYLLLMVLRGTSFSFFESEEFCLLPQSINKALKFVPNRHNIKQIITNKYADIQKQISSLVKEKLLNISIDGAVRKHRKFFGINTHIINNNKFYTLNLGITELYTSSTSKHLKFVLTDVLKNYQLNFKGIISLTCDNGANMLKYTSLIEMNINKEIDDGFFNEDINTANINNLNNNSLYNYNCSSDIWNSVNNDLDIITDLLAPYEKSHMEQFESNSVDCEKNGIVDIENQQSSFDWLEESVNRLEQDVPFYINRCAAHTYQLTIYDIIRAPETTQLKRFAEKGMETIVEIKYILHEANEITN